MDYDIEKLSWWSLTTRVLFSPRTFFERMREPLSYRRSTLYLAQTALVVSLINTLILTGIFYVVVSFFASFVMAFTVIFGTLLTPLIAVAANIPPDKVPSLLASFASNSGLQIGILSAKLGAFLFASLFGTIVISTFLQAGVAHGIARLTGCAGSFRDTATAYSFGSAAWMLSVVPIANVFAPIYGAVLDIFGMQSVHRLPGAKATLAVAAAASVPIIAFITYCSMSK